MQTARSVPLNALEGSGLNDNYTELDESCRSKIGLTILLSSGAGSARNSSHGSGQIRNFPSALHR